MSLKSIQNKKDRQRKRERKKRERIKLFNLRIFFVKYFPLNIFYSGRLGARRVFFFAYAALPTHCDLVVCARLKRRGRRSACSRHYPSKCDRGRTSRANTLQIINARWLNVSWTCRHDGCYYRWIFRATYSEFRWTHWCALSTRYIELI